MVLYWQLPIGKGQELNVPQGIERVLNRKKEIRRKLKPRPRHVIPRKKKEKIHAKYRSSKPKDHRFSDQQKLRRMFRNG